MSDKTAIFVDKDWKILCIAIHSSIGFIFTLNSSVPTHSLPAVTARQTVEINVSKGMVKAVSHGPLIVSRLDQIYVLRIYSHVFLRQ